MAARGPLLLGISLMVGACASGPQLPAAAELPPPPASAPSVAAVASQVSMTGPAGQAIGPRQREQVIEAVQAQGRGEALKRQLGAMAAFGDVGLYPGNEAGLLIDGPATYKAMFEAIQRARHTVLLESYIIEDAEVSRRLAALLAAKRAEGLGVFVVYDAVGSIGTQDAFFAALREAGVATCAFNPLGQLDDLTHRDHRKILVVDRETGFTGGINISAVYSSGSLGRHRRAPPPQDPDGKRTGWRDTQVQLRGPAVSALDDLVRQTWRDQKCEGTLPPPPAVPKKAAGEQLLRIIPTTPDDPVNRFYTMMMGAIAASQQSVLLTMAYFAPGEDMVDALCEAARRGVDVQLVLPSRSDFSPVLHAGRSYYARLLDAGVKIHELQDSVLHAKTVVIDGVVASVGSSNLDQRSFTGNNEINAVVIGEDFGAAMRRMFEQDLKDSREITQAAWRSRSLWQRSKEFFARVFERLW
ncbi:phosphatidylserine/phosphatidylglycerophosphate/cardiolipin synthase family protein [Pelomonas sp. KK5]|uniref:phospholipase D-like domain-containing protein n=1 Tax=Pelomonas sp. KK5 TaxID=1855730 RepID=UPI00097BCABC|nr:phospholipase D-like domain-containing protein [Pelomonas sp. KK5]